MGNLIQVMVVRHWTKLVCLLLLAAAPLPTHADLVTTIDGQTLEGLIREENKFYLTIDVRGVIIPIPRERIKEVVRASVDENVRSLLDRALEARSRDELVTARTLIEQARRLNSSNSDLVENLRLQDRELTDLEQRGGSAEVRRQRASVILGRANEAYDKVRIEEGNALLLQALRTDPTFEEAHRLMRRRLTEARDVDLEMAAEYFVSAVYPDNMAENPVLPLLPDIYAELANRFDQSLDIPKAQRYAELMTTIHKAFTENPALYANASQEAQNLISQPINGLLFNLVENNLKRGNAEFALRKLQGWADPKADTQTAMMYTRAYVGTGEFAEALSVMRWAAENSPEDTRVQSHANALDRMVQAQTAQKLGNATEALNNYQQVFDARSQLAEELGLAVGRELATLKFQQMEQIAAGTAQPENGYQLADIAAHVLHYSPNRDQQTRAAEVLVSALPRVPWALDLKFNLNGQDFEPEASVKEAAQTALKGPFNVAFDDKSPFKLSMNIGFAVPATSQTQIMAALAPGGTQLSEPYPSPGLTFGVRGEHPSLGQLLNESWRETALPAGVLARQQAAGLIAEGQPPFYARLQNQASLTAFVSQDLPEYMLARMGLLNSRVRIAKVQELLGPTTIQ